MNKQQGYKELVGSSDESKRYKFWKLLGGRAVFINDDEFISLTLFFFMTVMKTD